MNGKNSSKDSATDWTRLRQMSDAEIDLSDIPEVDADLLGQGSLKYGGCAVSPEELVVLRAAPDLAGWLRSANEGERSEALDALRQVMERHTAA
ncbi:MAG: hypothetical protein VX836_19510 [Pseudomonadota bacterium]|jgi:hypothetical protein|nr:hypothetical protein [Pseudomonadota bacterium]